MKVRERTVCFCTLGQQAIVIARFECHQLSYKSECFHKYKNGEKKALI